MALWMDLVKIEMENLAADQLIEPDALIEGGDHVVGELDMAMRRLYTLGLLYVKETVDTTGHLVVAQSNARTELESRAIEYQRKAELLRGLFWLSLNDQFELWTRPSVGVRRGWKVVWSDVEKRPGVLLRDLFG